MSKTWFITGASSGFGRHLTEQLLARGDRVAVTVRRPAAIADLADQYGDRLWSATLDVTDTPALRKVVDAAFADLGRIDVVVSNAGYALLGAAEEYSDAEVERQLDTNLLASIQLARAVVPHLRAQGGGRIVQLSSMGAHVSVPALSIYHASKWAIEGFYESVIPEIAPFGIGVTLVEPGGSRTEFTGRSMAFATALPAYDGTVVGYVRDRAGAGELPVGDPVKVARAIIDAADQEIAVKRLLLGSDSYAQVITTLRERLDELEPGKTLAHSTDA
ncbi:SDR family oxidoreductase [Kribbella sp. DT2]|uniref:SDR family oxidoreductase n=1 Tax=Kribbella sp. DT2 TaxID=3393427 RepID=UPI003CEDCB6B